MKNKTYIRQEERGNEENMRDSFERIVNILVRAIIAVVVFLLFLQSIFSTSFIGQIPGEDGGIQDHTLNVADSPFLHLGILLTVTVVSVVLYRAYQKREHNIQHIGLNAVLYIIAVAGFLLGTVWILATQLYPGSDPAKVCHVAAQWRAGDFSAFEQLVDGEEGYLFRYPFQSGIVLFYYLLMGILGTENYVGLQFVNLLALTVSYYLIVQILKQFWKEDKAAVILAHTALILWEPYMFYITYLYGIMPGMACSLGAVYCVVRYLGTRKPLYMLPAALLMGIATVFKMNCLIYLAAIGCFLVYDGIKGLLEKEQGKRTGKSWLISFLFLAVMGVGVAGTNVVVNSYVEHLSGYEMPEGQVMLSWVVMGLQEAPKGPGNYNGFNGNVYTKSNYDTELANELSKEALKAQLAWMGEDPVNNGLVFFARKTAYQWNDPTFISLDRMAGRDSKIEMSPAVLSLIEGKGCTYLSIWLNIVQTLVLLGALFYLLFTCKKTKLYELIVCVVFLGGFLFHLVWESSASYAIPYYVLMIPYAAKGFTEYIRWADRALRWLMEEAADRKKEDIRGFFSRKNAPLIGSAAVLLALLVLFGQTDLFKRTIAFDDDLKGFHASEQFYRTGDWTPED